MAPKAPHFPAKAKRVIFLFQAGAPSHLDLFDDKPELRKHDGTLPPAELLKGYRAAFINPSSTLLAPKFKFGQARSEWGRTLGTPARTWARSSDDIAIVKSMVTDAFNHAPAQIFMNTGSSSSAGRAWGRGPPTGSGPRGATSPASSSSAPARRGPAAGASNYGCGFLPTVHQGTRSEGRATRSSTCPTRPASTTETPAGLDRRRRRPEPAAPRRGGRPRDRHPDQQLRAGLSDAVLAPDLMDLSGETPETMAMYGAEPGKSSYANACLLARRLVERGTRFVQVFHEAWDHHGGLTSGLKEQCAEDRQGQRRPGQGPQARGLLDDTLVIWGGEFGRTPMVQGGNDGRDHHPNAFTMWMAGGGIKPGITLGKTDELGFNAAEDKVHVHDLHATILHLLGFDHTKLTHRFQGRDFRLTDVSGSVVSKLLA